MKKIIVAVDGSQSALKAVEKAREIQACFGSEVILYTNLDIKDNSTKVLLSRDFPIIFIISTGNAIFIIFELRGPNYENLNYIIIPLIYR